jgi:hypothetical protein
MTALTTPAPAVPAAKHGVCEYCLRETTVYAYILRTCKRCLDEDAATAPPAPQPPAEPRPAGCDCWPTCWCASKGAAR